MEVRKKEVFWTDITKRTSQEGGGHFIREVILSAGGPCCLWCDHSNLMDARAGGTLEIEPIHPFHKLLPSGINSRIRFSGNNQIHSLCASIRESNL